MCFAVFTNVYRIKILRKSQPRESYFPHTLNFSLFKHFDIFKSITFNEPSSNSAFLYTTLYLTA